MSDRERLKAYRKLQAAFDKHWRHLWRADTVQGSGRSRSIGASLKAVNDAINAFVWGNKK